MATSDTIHSLVQPLLLGGAAAAVGYFAGRRPVGLRAEARDVVLVRSDPPSTIPARYRPTRRGYYCHHQYQCPYALLPNWRQRLFALQRSIPVPWLKVVARWVDTEKSRSCATMSYPDDFSVVPSSTLLYATAADYSDWEEGAWEEPEMGRAVRAALKEVRRFVPDAVWVPAHWATFENATWRLVWEPWCNQCVREKYGGRQTPLCPGDNPQEFLSAAISEERLRARRATTPGPAARIWAPACHTECDVTDYSLASFKFYRVGE
jgi:hypothetical protein